MLSISLGKRLQWAEISFSGTCHESRYETPFGEAEITLFFLPLWTGVDNAMCGRWTTVSDSFMSFFFFVAVLFKNCPQVCKGEREREREPVQDCNKTYFHACVFN